MEELSLREIQLAALEVMKSIHIICEKNGINYYLIYGTLIGAVRHKGFIPWDDDIDIIMLRPDYDKFLKFFEEHQRELYPLQVINDRTEAEAPYMITRVSDDRYRFIPKYGKPYHLGVFVDVYPYDFLEGTQDSIRRLCRKSCQYSSNLGKCLQRDVISFNLAVHSKWKGLLNCFQYIIPKITGAEYYREHLRELCSNNQKVIGNYVGCLSWFMEMELTYQSAWFDDKILMEFEDAKFWIPKHYHEILAWTFGEYMQLPPENQRIAHHYYRIFMK